MNNENNIFLQALLNSLLGVLFAGLIFIAYGCAPKTNQSNDDTVVKSSCTIDTRGSNTSTTKNWPKNLKYKVVEKHSVDSPSFTQGLQYHQGRLYRSSGLYGKSFVSVQDFPSDTSNTDTSNSKNLIKVRLGDEFFGEGLTLHKEKLYQLTWKSGKVFVYGPNKLNKVDEMTSAGEGWGITSDGNQLYISDGSADIQFVDKDLSPLHTITVKLGSRPLRHLNELEWINGCIFANIWKSSSIAVIEPTSDKVTAFIDAAPLVKDQQQIFQERLANAEEKLSPLDVLNGIAYRPDNNSLLLTGKYWSTIYEIQLDTSKNGML